MDQPNIPASDGTMVFGQHVPRAGEITWCFEIVISTAILMWCLSEIALPVEKGGLLIRKQPVDFRT